MTAKTTTSSLDAIDAALDAAGPSLDEDEQRLAAAVLRLLAAGQPASIQAAAAAAGMPASQAEAALRSWPAVFWDDHDQVTGFWGLALAQMPHRIRHAGTGLGAWCAWDPLFLARVIGDLDVATADPVTRPGHHLPRRRRRHHHRRLPPERGTVIPAPRPALGRRRDHHLLPLRAALHRPGHRAAVDRRPPRHLRDQPRRRRRAGPPPRRPRLRRRACLTSRCRPDPRRRRRRITNRSTPAPRPPGSLDVMPAVQAGPRPSPAAVSVTVSQAKRVTGQAACGCCSYPPHGVAGRCLLLPGRRRRARRAGRGPGRRGRRRRWCRAGPYRASDPADEPAFERLPAAGGGREHRMTAILVASGPDTLASASRRCAGHRDRTPLTFRDVSADIVGLLREFCDRGYPG
jgi:hypothetical protein